MSKMEIKPLTHAAGLHTRQGDQVTFHRSPELNELPPARPNLPIQSRGDVVGLPALKMTFQ